MVMMTWKQSNARSRMPCVSKPSAAASSRCIDWTTCRRAAVLSPSRWHAIARLKRTRPCVYGWSRSRASSASRSQRTRARAVVPGVLELDRGVAEPAGLLEVARRLVVVTRRLRAAREIEGLAAAELRGARRRRRGRAGWSPPRAARPSAEVGVAHHPQVARQLLVDDVRPIDEPPEELERLAGRGPLERSLRAPVRVALVDRRHQAHPSGSAPPLGHGRCHAGAAPRAGGSGAPRRPRRR